MENTILIGNAGPGIRSDCKITLDINSSGGIQIELKSKVNSMYGKSIRNLIADELSFFGIENAKVKVEDSGALAFVIAARLEYAIKKGFKSTKEFLPEFIEENKYSTTRDRFRFSRLYLPGNTPSLMLNAGIHQPNGVILDLEDSVSLEKKGEAQYLIRNALRQIDFMGAERMVRINQLPLGLDDLKFIIPHNVQLILIPKCEGPEQVRQLEEKIERIKKEIKVEVPGPIYLMPIIESALGVEEVYDIAKSSANVVAMAIGLEDYTADIGVGRTLGGEESLYARSRLVNACKAAGIQPIDSVFSDVADLDGLRKAIQVSKSLGFEGMGCIHPRQVPVIHEGYAPAEKEILKAMKIVHAFEKAKEKGLGVVSLGTKMIDAPVVKRAMKTIQLATDLDIISKDWREEFES